MTDMKHPTRVRGRLPPSKQAVADVYDAEPGSDFRGMISYPQYPVGGNLARCRFQASLVSSWARSWSFSASLRMLLRLLRPSAYAYGRLALRTEPVSLPF